MSSSENPVLCAWETTPSEHNPRVKYKTCTNLATHLVKETHRHQNPSYVFNFTHKLCIHHAKSAKRFWTLEGFKVEITKMKANEVS